MLNFNSLTTVMRGVLTTCFNGVSKLKPKWVFGLEISQANSLYMYPTFGCRKIMKFCKNILRFFENFASNRGEYFAKVSDFAVPKHNLNLYLGFFGEVFRGIWNGTDAAIKIFPEQELTAENMEDFCNEIFILSRLRRPNVILFLGACTRPPHLSMVTEYMEMGSLYYLIHMTGQKKIRWCRRLKTLRDICRGLMYIHCMKIVHQDLKCANFLLNKHWTVKICDSGLSRVLTEVPMRDSSSAGTPEWMAPELIRNDPWKKSATYSALE